ncbi:MAG: hypothetical protein ACYDCN_13360 [Bacteroidia bacterium]
MNYSRKELYSKTIVQLCNMLNISQKEYLNQKYSKEQLVEFILTPQD